MTISDPFDVDVVIVGAGFTGLTVATELAHSAASFVLLEARDRIGGKTEAQVDDRGRLVDTGGQFANDDMLEVLRLAAAVGAERINALRPGRAVTVPVGVEGDPWQEAEALLDGLGSDHLHDDRSIMQWVQSLGVRDPVRDAVRSAINGATCSDSRRVPVSAVAQFNEHTPMTAPELQSWFRPTMHSLADHLARPLADRTRLECPVRAVHVHDESVDVVALNHVWHARQVVIAAPPSAYRSLFVTPPLPDDILDAAATFEPGTVIKYLLGYPRPFWLDHGRSGIGQFLTPPGVYFADASLPDAPTLVGFVGGTTAQEWTRHSEAQRRAAVLHHAATAFSSDALQPETFLERVWAADEWGGGGYSNVQTTHSPHAADTLVAGLPLVTFASTELSARFPGYVEGAIHAGKAAAAKVLRRLGPL